MRTAIKACISILLATLASVVLAAPLSLPHDEFMPPDRNATRPDKPEQMLLEVENYRVSAGLESRQGPVGKLQQSSLWLFLDGRSLLRGNNALRSVRVGFVEDAKVLPPPRYEPDTQTLALFYPMGYFDVLTALLASSGPHFVQARFYGNGTIWADIHAGPLSAR